jgi:hypothetical protein
VRPRTRPVRSSSRRHHRQKRRILETAEVVARCGKVWTRLGPEAGRIPRLRAPMGLCRASVLLEFCSSPCHPGLTLMKPILLYFCNSSALPEILHCIDPKQLTSERASEDTERPSQISACARRFPVSPGSAADLLLLPLASSTLQLARPIPVSCLCTKLHVLVALGCLLKRAVSFSRSCPYSSTAQPTPRSTRSRVELADATCPGILPGSRHA